ncbi:MAG: RusA family crossover junction endodeoxyribonuclease [Paraclostridium sp.]
MARKPKLTVSEEAVARFEHYQPAKLEKGKYKGKFTTFNRKLTITLPGEPIVDSRPRVTDRGSVTINKNKIVEYFKRMYNSDPLLKKTVVLSEYMIEVIGYYPMSDAELRNLKKNFPQEFLKYQKELLPCINEKDVDNLVKLQNDLIIDQMYRICINDNFNTELHGYKVYSENPRTEIVVYYIDKPSGWIHEKILATKSFFDLCLSEKYMFWKDITPIKQRAHFFTSVENSYKNQKEVAIKKAILISAFTEVDNFNIDKLEFYLAYQDKNFKDQVSARVLKNDMVLLLRKKILKMCGITENIF